MAAHEQGEDLSQPKEVELVALALHPQNNLTPGSVLVPLFLLRVQHSP